MVILEHCLEREEGIRDEKVQRRRQQRMAQLAEAIRQRGDTPNPMVLQCARITQRSLQFIRWLNAALFRPTSWNASITTLRLLMQEYLA